MFYKTIVFTVLLMTCGVSATLAQNGFKLEQSVIASGGGTAADAGGNTFALVSTIGQPVAGGGATNAPFKVESGFLYGTVLVPTAATVTVSGRVLTAQGKGILRVTVKMTDAAGQTRTAVTGKGGVFYFTDVAAGETYVFSVAARSFTFAVPVVVKSVTEDLTDMNFIANGSLFTSR